MTIDPHDVEAQVRTGLHRELDALPAEGPAWLTVHAALGGRANAARRRRTTIVATTGLAALSLVLAVTLPSHRTAPSVTQPKVAHQLQLATQRALGTLTSPPIVAGHGSIFAAVWDAGKLLRLDPVTLQTTGTLQVGESRNGPLSVAYGLGSLWVLNFADSSLWRVDPTSMKRIMRVPLRGQPSQVAIGDGSVWVTECCMSTSTASRQLLLRLDPATGATIRSTRIPGDGETVRVAVGAVVVVSSENAPVVVVDPQTMQVLRTLPTDCASCGSGSLAVASDATSVYVGGADGVQRYPATSGQPTATHGEPSGISAVTTDGATIWAASENRLVGLDPTTLKIITTGPPLQAPAVAFTLGNSVYASVYGGVARLTLTQ